MRRLVFASLCAFVCAWSAFAERVNVGGVWVEVPDSADSDGGGDPSVESEYGKTAPHALYARRGSLGANDYVVTNVAPCASAYLMNDVKNGKLRDRAVNVVTVTGGEAVFELPLRRTVGGFARSLLVAVTAEEQTRISLTGANGLWGTMSRKDTLELCAGTHLIQIVEIGKAVYLVEARELTEFKEE